MAAITVLMCECLPFVVIQRNSGQVICFFDESRGECLFGTQWGRCMYSFTLALMNLKL